ncbi:MAG: thiamine phosphate synthase [Brachymonas sp.]|nr:thiamine phosphate synthase [Brachymonas sp.]
MQPFSIHSLDWQQALLDVPASASPMQRDIVVAGWAQRCWEDLCTALPQQRHAVIAHPGQVQEHARFYMATEHASGWLHSPLFNQEDAPRWRHEGIDTLLHTSWEAAHQGFCGADALVLGVAAVLAELDNRPRGASENTGLQRRHFPLLGTPRTRNFAAMPVEILQPGHAWGVYPVMNDADWVLRCMEMGAKLVQLRLKDVAADMLDADIARCAAAAQRHGALLFINDHWQAALRLAPHMPGIYGVHLGQEDLLTLREQEFDALLDSGLRLGVSSQTLWELARALRLRPSCIACSPVHATASKDDVAWPPAGEHNLRFWAQIAHGTASDTQQPLPLIAIGGMNVPRARDAAAAGADAVAMVSAISKADDPPTAVQVLQKAVAEGLEQRAQAPDGQPVHPQATKQG